MSFLYHNNKLILSYKSRLFLHLNYESVPFRLKVFNQRLCLRPTSIDLDIQDFHLYFITIWYFQIPTWE